jgi:hypothetical protein
MAAEPEVGVMPYLRSRAEYFDFLEGYTVERSKELDRGEIHRALVKSYMLETVCSGAQRAPHPADLFLQLGIRVDAVDDSLFRLEPYGAQGIWALLDIPDRRYVVVHTLRRADESDAWMAALVHQSSWLDRVWLSAPVFEQLWRYVVAVTRPSRYTRITFEHQGIYDVDRADEEYAGQRELAHEPDDLDGGCPEGSRLRCR